MNKILVLQGVPASGKSTFAKELAENDKSWLIVSRDAIREGKGIYWETSHENYVSKVEEFQVRTAVEDGYNVVIDATNLSQETIDKWIDVACDLEVDIDFKLFQISYADALERDKNRKRPVGPAVMTRFFKQYFPDEPLTKNPPVLKDERFIVTQDETLPKCVIVDLDGTLALRTNRTYYEYDKVDTDIPNTQLLEILHKLEKEGVIINFITGRENKSKSEWKTCRWIANQKIGKYNLFMRQKGDHRQDDIIKSEIYEKHIKDQYNVIGVFEDRDRVVKMWRDLGLLCCQVYYGDF